MFAFLKEKNKRKHNEMILRPYAVMIKYDYGTKGSLNQMFQEVDGRLHLVKCNELQDLIK